MKRRIAVFAVCGLMLFLCACQGKPADQDIRVSSGPVEEPPAVTNTVPEAAPTPTVTTVLTQTPASEPGPESTPELTPAPTPTATPQPTNSAVSSAELEAYFEDTVFIGDSIMEGIRQYVAKNRAKEPTLGSAEFLTSTIGVSVADLLEGEKDGPFYRYKGTGQPLLQILPQMGCKRIFLQLGLNDMAAADPIVAESIEQYAQLIDLLQDTVPDAEIIVITNPPKVASAWLPSYTPNRSFGNKLIAEYVDALIQMCEKRGILYVDAHAALLDDNGALPDGYCRDGFVHLNDAGSEVVVEELYRFAEERIGQGP